MGRRIFEERGYHLNDFVIPYEEFKVFFDQEQGLTFNKDLIPSMLERAEEFLNMEIPQQYASQYMMYKRNGNRTVFQNTFHPRRTMAYWLAIGEYIEGKGRFLDKLIDVLWLICEETTWVVPAHNKAKAGISSVLPYVYQGDYDCVDLFCASTGAVLAVVYHLCKDKLDAVTTLITERLQYEVEKRIIEPFLNDAAMSKINTWCGINGNRVNNWCPWIVSNVLTVNALMVKDTTKRKIITRRSIGFLDNFTQTYHPDGGCDEGPSYWNVSGGALFGACLLLNDLTAGKVNVFDDPLIRNMGEYAVKAVVSSSRMLNFADASSKVSLSPQLVYLWGKYCNSKTMMSYAMMKQNGGLCDVKPDIRQPYRLLRFFTMDNIPQGEFIPEKKCYIGGLEIAVSRETNEFDKGFYLAFKGGHNAENHNHNDVGSVIVFHDDKPIFIDAGVGAYTRRTFSGERYTIWSMCSDYHNCATFNGVAEKNGPQYCSRNTVYDPQSGKMTLDLKSAYPEEADIESYTRSAELTEGTVKVVDKVALKNNGSVMFSYIVRVKPEQVGEGYFKIEGRTVSYDKDLEYAIEELDKTWPEVSGIPRGWDTEYLYRITLSTVAPIKEKEFVLIVK